MEEVWKPIVNYEGYFEISSFGRIKSVERHVKQGNSVRHVKEKLKKNTHRSRRVSFSNTL